MIEFTPWPKIARLNRDIVVTEKIDGTNAAVGVVEGVSDGGLLVEVFGMPYTVYAQSRKQLITPESDNFGFAGWAYTHAAKLAAILGPGLHFGEWWGSGIQRGYDMPKGHKRFSLFNTKRWADSALELANFVPGLRVVPVLYEGPFSQTQIAMELHMLRTVGSRAAGGFDRPEGVVIYHKAADQMFKVTLEGDEAPKSAVLQHN